MRRVLSNSNLQGVIENVFLFCFKIQRFRLYNIPMLPVLIKQRVHIFNVTLTTHNRLNKPFTG